MDTQHIVVDPAKARELWRAYRKHQHYSTPIDAEICRAYQLLAQKRLVIRALESVIKAGLGADGWPKLALCRADKVAVRCTMQSDGSAVMTAEGFTPGWRRTANNSVHFNFSRGSFPGAINKWSGRALVPLIPIMHRPKRGLANYHILWEAEWSRVIPKDPYLLRRIGKSDMWVVLAMWELSDVERAVLAARL